jgi:hypothetical protein
MRLDFLALQLAGVGRKYSLCPTLQLYGSGPQRLHLRFTSPDYDTDASKPQATLSHLVDSRLYKRKLTL